VTATFRCAKELTDQMVAKGSVAVDGVSLTVVEVHTDHFSVMLIPHTLQNTTLGRKGPGAAVNIETDILAKHVQRMLENVEIRI
ncbi:MAG TPA: riboflavin synthase, partial [Gemmataceae bacterium]